MLRFMAKSKIHGLRITATELNYAGSLTLDQDLMEVADLLPGERVQIVNLNNGSRIETYMIIGERGSGVACLNGPAARAAVVGDRVHVICYCLVSEQEAREWQMKVITVDDANRPLKASGA